MVVENIGGGGSSLSVNGVGKSTLLRSIMGQDEHDQHIFRRIKG
jgi:ATPase subunit of ABC transporter with duplicated ATPase domains